MVLKSIMYQGGGVLPCFMVFRAILKASENFFFSCEGMFTFIQLEGAIMIRLIDVFLDVRWTELFILKP